MTPLISIIIPCYNAEKYVAEAIQCALDQTHADCEVIVIDDGSTDGSLQVIKGFGDRIRWETGPNRGGCVARNRGIELANGEWLQFLDADDRIHRTKIEKQMTLLAMAPPGAIATCGWAGMNPDGTRRIPPRRRFWKCYEDSTDLLIDGWNGWGSLVAHTWLISKQDALDVGGWDNHLCADQDGDFFGMIMSKRKKVVFVDEILCEYRLPEESNVSSNSSRKAFECRMLSTRKLVRELSLMRNFDMAGRIAARNRWLQLALTFKNAPLDLRREAAREAAAGKSGHALPPPCGRMFPQLARILGYKLAFETYYTLHTDALASIWRPLLPIISSKKSL